MNVKSTMKLKTQRNKWNDENNEIQIDDINVISRKIVFC